MSHHIFRAGGLLLAMASGPVLAGPNLLSNDRFDNANSLGPGSGWTVQNSGGTLTWATSPDHNGGPGSGSVHAVGNFSLTGILHQCVSVAPNTDYTYGAWLLLASGPGPVLHQVNWFASANCSGNSLSSSNALTAQGTSSWAKFSNTVTSPAGVTGADLTFAIGFGATDMSLDDAFFGLPPLAPVSLQSFDVK